MATASNYLKTLSLADVASMKNPDGSTAKIAEVLTQYNPMLGDIPFVEGNTETGTVITRRQSIGEAYWRRLNSGVKTGVSRTTQVTETCGILETYSEVDKRLVSMASDKEAFMLSQAKGQMEAMSQEMAETFLYGNSYKQPEKFLGLMPRLDKLNKTVRNGSPIVLDAGGTNSGHLASILLVGWGEDKVCGIYPKGSKAGLDYEDLGQVTLEDGNGGKYEGYRSHWTWEAGLAVHDYRYVIRIANIDTTTLDYSDENAVKKLAGLMIDALSLIPVGSSPNLKAYAPREVWAYISKLQLANNSRNVNVPTSDSARLVSDFYGVPFKMMDCMLSTETKVS